MSVSVSGLQTYDPRPALYPLESRLERPFEFDRLAAVPSRRARSTNRLLPPPTGIRRQDPTVRKLPRRGVPDF